MDATTRILHISDGHGFLPRVDASLGIDLIAFTGDHHAEYGHDLERQITYCAAAIAPWLDTLPAPVVAIPGNHDSLAATGRGLEALKNLDWTYLVDESATVGDLSVFGSPWTRPTDDSVFVAPEIELAQKWNQIPENLDLLLTHCPPLGWQDGGFGSPSLREHVSLVRPRAHLFGHVHSTSGVDASYSTVFSNGSIVGQGLVPTGEASIIILGADRSVDFERVCLGMDDCLRAA